MPTEKQERLAEIQRMRDDAERAYEKAIAAARRTYNETRNEPRRIYDDALLAARQIRDEARRAYNAARSVLR